ncbi:GGDEF domain-containing protein, partial [Enterobacter chengduensis]
QLTEIFNKLMAEADDQLYRSKKAGRNRTSARVSDEPIGAPSGSETSLR